WAVVLSSSPTLGGDVARVPGRTVGVSALLADVYSVAPHLRGTDARHVQLRTRSGARERDRLRDLGRPAAEHGQRPLRLGAELAGAGGGGEDGFQDRRSHARDL